MKHIPLLALACTLGSAASAQSYDFALDGSLSTTNLATSVDLALPGSASGDYDAVKNTAGTITCPGVFGTCSNTAIAMTTNLLVDTKLVGAPSGGFQASFDTALGAIAVSGLSIDALGGQSGAADIAVSLLYPTFHTFQPTALFPSLGTIPITIPLGQVTASNVQIAQVGPVALGTLTPAFVPDVYDVDVLVPATLSLDVDFLGQVTTLGPLPFALPVTGSLDLGGGQAHLSMFVDAAAMQTIDDPLGTQTFDDVPLDLPTILPPGSTAHLLFDLDPDDLILDFAASLEWFSTGVPACDAQGYCVSTPNTFGAGAHIASSGTSSIAVNDLVLSCTGVPPLHPARVCMGSMQALSVLGDGVLCIGGTMRRFKVVASDALGGVSFPIDFTDPTQPAAGVITAGSTWNFQLVYRDPLGGAATFNTSDALSVTFCP